MSTPDLPPVVTEADLQALSAKLDALAEALPPAEQFALACVLQRAAAPLSAPEVAGHGYLVAFPTYYYVSASYWAGTGAVAQGAGAGHPPGPGPGPGGTGS